MASQGSMHNLTTLIKRLEAATSRLEDIATTVDGNSNLTNGAAETTQHTSGAAIAAAPAAPVPPAPQEPLPRSIEDFDKLIEEDVTAFVTASGKIGGLVEEQAKAVQSAFEAERTYLLVTTKAKKPDTDPPELVTELHRWTSTVDEIRMSNRPSPLFTHLSAVAEGILALAWIVEKRPADFVGDTLGGAQYYGNKVLKDYKEKDKSHVEWIQAYYKIFRSLAAYVKQYFATGLTWNQKDGIDCLEALKQIQGGGGAATPKASVQPAAGGPPPPPPPPLPVFDDNGVPAPPPPPPGAAPAAKSAYGDMGAVFDQINSGSSVTSHLKKVDKSQMTHKNPSLRTSAPVPERTSSQSSSASRGKSPIPNKKPDSMRTKKPGKKELDGSKWLIENFDNTGSEIINVKAELNHSILISRCNKAVIKVDGKANAISIDNCNGLSIVIDSLVSSLDVIKSPKFAVQVDGVLPTILLDQVDGAQVYLSLESLGTEIFSSKCSNINIVVPPSDEEGGDEGDSKEFAVPEQIRTVVAKGGKKLESEIVEHAG